MRALLRTDRPGLSRDIRHAAAFVFNLAVWTAVLVISIMYGSMYGEMNPGSIIGFVFSGLSFVCLFSGRKARRVCVTIWIVFAGCGLPVYAFGEISQTTNPALIGQHMMFFGLTAAAVMFLVDKNDTVESAI